MNQYTPLKTTPIIEAIIEIRFDPANKTTLKQLEAYSESIKSDYPHSEPMYTFDIKHEIALGESSTASKALEAGFRLKDNEKHKTIVALHDKFVYSITQPYLNWPALNDLMKPLYLKYLEFTKQQAIIRVGMRYINKVLLPIQPGEDIKEYIRTCPTLPNNVPDILNAFELAYQIPIDDKKCDVTIRQSYLPAEPDPEDDSNLVYPFILDIDAVRTYKSINTSDEQIWSDIAVFRDVKNDVFFGVLTEKALKRYN